MTSHNKCYRINDCLNDIGPLMTYIKYTNTEREPTEGLYFTIFDRICVGGLNTYPYRKIELQRECEALDLEYEDMFEDKIVEEISNEDFERLYSNLSETVRTVIMVMGGNDVGE